MKISKEFKVGLFMVVSLTLLYLGFNFLKGIDFFRSIQRYYAIYDNVDRLMPSNQVLINGVEIGRVSQIDILQRNGNRVLVELEINSGILLNDSTVAILTGDFLGNKSILLDIGNGARTLKPGDTLRSTLDRGIADILAQSAVPVADNLQATLRKFNTLVDNLVKNTQQLDTIFQRLQTTPYYLNQTLASATTNVDDLAENFKTVASNLNTAMTDLHPTIKNFHELSDSLKSLELSETVRKMQATLQSLNNTLGRLDKGDNTVSKLLTEEELYNNLNGLLLNLDSLAKNFNHNPKHFLSPLGKNKNKIERDRTKEQNNK